MNKLFIDTCSENIILALINGKKYKIKIIKTEKNMTEIFISELDGFLKENKSKIELIKDVYIINGPGSFSGVRVGCNFVNVLKLINNVNLYFLSSCQFLIKEKSEIALINAKSKKYFYFYKNEIKMEEISQIEKIAFKDSLKIVDGYLNFSFAKSWEKNKNKFILADLVKPNYVKKAI